MSTARTRLAPFLLVLVLPFARASADGTSPGPVPPSPAPKDAAPDPAPAPKPVEPASDAMAHPAEVAFEPGTPAYADALAKAKTVGKALFLDFSTEWCGYCKKLDQVTFSVPAVAKVMESFVAVRIDAEKGEGIELRKRFGVRGFPTLVFVGADDAEIDRIVGFLPPEPFEKEVRRILAGEGTIPSLRKACEASPDDLALGFALAKRLSAANASDAVARLESLAARAAGKDREIEAGATTFLAQADLAADRLDDALVKLDHVALDLADTAAAKDAVRLSISLRVRGKGADATEVLAFVARLRAASKDGKLDGATEQMVARLHLLAAEQAMGRAAAAAEGDPQALNAIAWTCFERRLALVAATEWAQKAVEGSQRDPAILDTLANLYAAQKRYDDAILTELDAIGRLTDANEAMRRDFERNVGVWVGARDAIRAESTAAGRKAPAKPAPPSK